VKQEGKGGESKPCNSLYSRWAGRGGLEKRKKKFFEEKGRPATWCQTATPENIREKKKTTGRKGRERKKGGEKGLLGGEKKKEKKKGGIPPRQKRERKKKKNSHQKKEGDRN